MHRPPTVPAPITTPQCDAFNSGLSVEHPTVECQDRLLTAVSVAQSVDWGSGKRSWPYRALANVIRDAARGVC